MTPIHQSIRAGDLEQVARHIALGADLEARDEDGRTPLMIAAADARNGSTMVRLLLEHGADVNAEESLVGTDAAFLFEDELLAYNDVLPDGYPLPNPCEDIRTVLALRCRVARARPFSWYWKRARARTTNADEVATL